MTNHRGFVRASLALIIAAAAAVPACAKHETTPPPSDVRAQVARLQRANRQLQQQIDLASGKEFYLVVDPGASTIALMLSGAELQRYSVLGLQVGRPRVSWFTRHQQQPWQDVIWSHGELDPSRQLDRLVIQAVAPGTAGAEPEAPPVPATPEELYPVPLRYHVRFDQGRSIEVRPLDADAQAGRVARLRAWWSAKWRDGLAAVSGTDRDTVRVRIVLTPKDAASLYRSLPPAVRLVIRSAR
jgi:hypothetical protein